MSSNYHMEKKTFVEASCTNNIHTWEKVFLQLVLSNVCERFLFKKSKKNCSIIWCVWVFNFISREEKTKKILFMRSKFSVPLEDI